MTHWGEWVHNRILSFDPHKLGCRLGIHGCQVKLQRYGSTSWEETGTSCPFCGKNLRPCMKHSAELWRSLFPNA